jgi:curved DNA-binding protein CbpA
MPSDNGVDHYEVLQVSPNAEQETIQRLYRVLAQRFHPDNRETGDEARFRELSEAYAVLSDPARRARYDVAYHEMRQDRWRLFSAGHKADDNFALEQMFRVTLLEVLYSRRRIEPYAPTLYPRDLESMLGRSNEELEFTIWYLLQKRFITRDDQSRLMITAEGVDYLEQNYRAAGSGRRQLPEHHARTDAA